LSSSTSITRSRFWLILLLLFPKSSYDNDEPGNLMAQKVRSQLPNSVRKLPKAIDWNEELLNTFDWSSTSRINEIKKPPQREPSRDGGLSL
jgi:hypothetical protein